MNFGGFGQLFPFFWVQHCASSSVKGRYRPYLVTHCCRLMSPIDLGLFCELLDSFLLKVASCFCSQTCAAGKQKLNGFPVASEFQNSKAMSVFSFLTEPFFHTKTTMNATQGKKSSERWKLIMSARPSSSPPSGTYKRGSDSPLERARAGNHSGGCCSSVRTRNETLETTTSSLIFANDSLPRAQIWK